MRRRISSPAAINSALKNIDSVPARDSLSITDIENFGHVARIAMEVSPEWQRVMSNGGDQPILDDVSLENINRMANELGNLSISEINFLEKLASASVALSHGTDYGMVIKSQGFILCGPLVPMDVNRDLIDHNGYELSNEHHVFLRMAADRSQVSTPHLGQSTWVFENDESQRSFFDKGWFSFYDLAKPFSGSIGPIEWPKELGPCPEGMDPLLRDTCWNDSVGSRAQWVHTYPNGGKPYSESLSETVFVGRDFYSAVGYKVLLELRRIQDNSGSSIGRVFRDTLLAANSETIAGIVYRDFFRIEAKVPFVMSVQDAELMESAPTFDQFRNGPEFPFGSLEPAIKLIQNFKVDRGVGPSKKGGAKYTKGCLIDLEIELKKIFPSVKMMEVNLRAKMAECLNHPELVQGMLAFSKKLRQGIDRVIRLSPAEKMQRVTHAFLDFMDSILKHQQQRVSATKATSVSDSSASASSAEVVQFQSPPPELWNEIIQRGLGEDPALSSRILGSLYLRNPEVFISPQNAIWTENRKNIVGLLNLFIANRVRRSDPPEISPDFSGQKVGHRWVLKLPDFLSYIALTANEIKPAFENNRPLSKLEYEVVNSFCLIQKSRQIMIDQMVYAGKVQDCLDRVDVVVALFHHLKGSAGEITTCSIETLKLQVRNHRKSTVDTAYLCLPEGKMWPSSMLGTVESLRSFSARNLVKLKTALPTLSKAESNLCNFIVKNLTLFKLTNDAELCLNYGAMLSATEAAHRYLDIKSNNTQRNVAVSGMGSFAFMRLGVAPLHVQSKTTLWIDPSPEIMLEDRCHKEWIEQLFDPSTNYTGREDEPAILMLEDPLSGLGRRGPVEWNGAAIRCCDETGVTYPYRDVGEGSEKKKPPSNWVFVGDDIPEAFGRYVVFQLRALVGRVIDDVRPSDNPAEQYISEILACIDPGNRNKMGYLLDRLMAAQVAFPVSAQFSRAIWKTH